MALRLRLQNATEPPVGCTQGASGLLYYDGSKRKAFICNGEKYVVAFSAAGLPGAIDNPGLSCKHLLAEGVKSTGTYYIDPDGDGAAYGPVQVHCDMTTGAGGWTRVLQNNLKSDLSGLVFKKSGSDCSNSVQKVTANGFWIGHGNGSNTIDVPQMGKVEWTIEMSSPIVVLDATEVRHEGVFQNHSDYDHAGAPELISSSPFANEGDWAAQAFNGSGWSWFIFYKATGTVSFDLWKSFGAIKPPYIRWGYTWGGPNSCDAANSDGGYTRDWAIYVR